MDKNSDTAFAVSLRRCASSDGNCPYPHWHLGKAADTIERLASGLKAKDAELTSLKAENADLIARLERAEKALEQAVDAGSLAVVTVVKDAGYGMWRYEGVECIVGQSATENFFAGHPEDSPELAAWLKERR